MIEESHARGHLNYDIVCIQKARKVLRKYKKMSLKKEMQRLRKMLPSGETLDQTEVLEKTILMIQQLEMKLLRRIQESGIPVQLLDVMGGRREKNREEKIDRTLMRSLVSRTMKLR